MTNNTHLHQHFSSSFCNMTPHIFSLPYNIRELTIGREAGNNIIFCDQHISSRHLSISIISDYSAEIIVSGRNGMDMNDTHYERGERVAADMGELILLYGCGIIICKYHVIIFADSDSFGTSFVEIDYIGLSEKMINSVISETFNTSVRVNTVPNMDPIEVDGPPQRKAPDIQPILLVAGPALTIAVPILLGAGRKIMVIAGLIAAVWATTNVLFRRSRMRAEEKKRRRVYGDYIKDRDRIIYERFKSIRNRYIVSFPPLNEYLTGGGNSHLLWNRGEDDDLKHNIRIGTGDIAFPVEIRIPKEKFAVTEDSILAWPQKLVEKYAVMKDIPIAIGVENGRKYAILTETVNEAYEIMSALVLQAAVCFKGSEMKVVVSIGDTIKIRWGAYLANCWMGNIPLIASYENFSKLETVFTGYDGKIILVTDSRGIFDIYSDSGATVILIAKRYEELPPRIETVLSVSGSFSGLIFTQKTENVRQAVDFDHIGQNEALVMSKAVSAISSHAGGSERAIPEKVLFDDVIGIDRMNEAYILDNWNAADSSFSLSAPIGMEKGGKIVCLDLDEKFDGPHGLVAGTTGSGKSELLQTLVLSLAVHYPPSQIGFFLIDYKGGGMANAFTDLPHVCGSISNLSGSVIERAMISIKSEIEYRQRLFAQENVNSICDYISCNPDIKLPHLVIIVDEFAELKREEPDFLAKLVSVAQVGRSLGVHLILATQKPAGIVDDKIWSNSRFRICLKVRDKMDSTDMLHRPDAAFITNVGRAFLQVGNDEVFMEFQSAYSSAPVNQRSRAEDIYLYDKDLNRKKLLAQSTLSQREDVTVKDILIRSINHAYTLSGEPQVRKLWCDELPQFLYIEENEYMGQLIYGLYDDPYSQKCGKCLYLPDISKNTVIIGLQGSGKSYLLLRILKSLILSTKSVNYSIYIVDFGGKLLLPFAESDLCGGYISQGEYERIPKLFRFVNKELKRRLESGTCENDRKLLIVIDNYGSMMEYCRDDTEQIELMRVSASVGIFFLITANSIGQGELPGKVFNFMDTVIALSMRDKYSYAGAFSASTSQIPMIEQFPGRGLMSFDKRVLQFQAYLPTESEDENSMIDSIAHVIKTVNIGILKKAPPFPYVPSKPVLSELSTFFKKQSEGILYGRSVDGNKLSTIPIGYIEESGELYCLPYEKVKLFLISGRPRSGRKNTLAVIEYMAGMVKEIKPSHTNTDHINAHYINTHRIKTHHINSITELLEIEKGIFEHGSNEYLMLLSENLGQLIEDFYAGNYKREDEDAVVTVIENLNNGEGRLILVGIISQKDRMKCAGRRIWNVIMEHPYGICLGGSLEEQTLFDFSYMSYSMVSKKRSPGHGSISLYDENMFFGDVIFPKIDV